MKEFEYRITDGAGLHARPAGMLVREAKKYSSRIRVFANGKECEMTHLLALMAMSVKCGTTVRVTVEGEDESACARELKEYFEKNL